MVIFQMCNNYLQVAAVVKAAGYRNDEIDRICEQLKRKYLHVKERYPAVAPVACLGPSGVGKSSTTNSIFHQIGAAYESDSPGRGTNLVHEFTAPSTYGTALFQVAAPYLRENQIRDLVTLHYGNVLEYLSLEEAEKSDDDSTQRKYDTAIEFFRVLLCDHEEFSDDQSTKDYLESVAEDDIDDVIEDLRKTHRGLQEDEDCAIILSSSRLTTLRSLRISSPRSLEFPILKRGGNRIPGLFSRKLSFVTTTTS